MSALKIAARAGLASTILLLGVGVLAALVASKAEPKKVPRAEHAILVEVTQVEHGTQPIVITAYGNVIPAKEVLVIPEVSGRVRWQHKDLVPGGRIKAGETILRLDPTSYALQAAAQSASLDQARQQLALERSRKRIAESEWQSIGEDANATAEGRSVALREPQLKVAEASVKAAESARNLARVSLGRTSLRAPFNAFVRHEAVDLGQLVGPQSVLATLVGTDAFWVQVSVPLDKLARMRIPGVNAQAGEGSSARVLQRMGEQTVTRTGYVVRLMGDLDPAGRMARVLIEVPDPLVLGETAAQAPRSGSKMPQGKSAASQELAPGEAGAESPLPPLLGAYVQVEIDGGELQGVVKVPRLALRTHPETGKTQVFVNGADNRLLIHDAQVSWGAPDHVLVRGALGAQDQVVVSRVPAPVAGMKLQVLQSKVRAPSAGKGPPTPATAPQASGEQP